MRNASTSDLVDEMLTAHGGADLWRSVTSITARGRLGGLLPKRFPSTKLASFAVQVRVAEQHTVLHDFPSPGQRSVLELGRVRIETDGGDRIAARSNPRDAFAGLSGLRRNFRWDPLDTAYFAGYAFWNYLTAPALLARPDVAVTAGDARHDAGEQWRRLDAAFPPDIDTHCRHQSFYLDPDGLFRRHDFVAEPVGRWASAALLCDRHREFDGLIFPTRRRVFPRGPGGRVLAGVTLLDLQFDEIDVERNA